MKHVDRTRDRQILKKNKNKRIRLTGIVYYKYTNCSKNGNKIINVVMKNAESPNLNKKIEHINIPLCQKNINQTQNIEQLIKTPKEITLTAEVVSYTKKSYNKQYGIKNIKDLQIIS